MNKKFYAIIILVVVLCLALGDVVFHFLPNSNKAIASGKKTEMVLYYSNACPHCQKALQFVDKYKLEEKIPLVEKEVTQDPNNLKEFIARAQACRLNTQEIPVPVLWTGRKCLVGDKMVLMYLRKGT